jgi:hypothetical protein
MASTYDTDSDYHTLGSAVLLRNFLSSISGSYTDLILVGNFVQNASTGFDGSLSLQLAMAHLILEQIIHIL